jgi:ketosteroid isomerase-like protein
MNTPEISRTIGSLDRGEVLPRRSFLQLGVGGLAAGAVAARGGHNDSDNRSLQGIRRRTERVVRQLYRAFDSRDTSAIWSFFADDGVFEFPFIGLRAVGFESFDEQLAGSFAALEGLKNSDFVFEPLADPEALIVRHNATATVSFTGKPLNEMYLDVAHLRHGKVTSFAVYYDTAVFNEAITP